jgi:cysteine sulfinate desulfinase/cysteine desulfurase-like protein
LLDNGSVNIPAEANARNNRTAVFSIARAARDATERCGKHISEAVNQRAAIEEAVFSVGAAPMLYNEDLTHLKLELS